MTSMSRRRRWLGIAAAVAAMCIGPTCVASAQDTQIVFTMTQLIVIARAPNTNVTITNLANGQVWADFNLPNEGSR